MQGLYVRHKTSWHKRIIWLHCSPSWTQTPLSCTVLCISLFLFIQMFYRMALMTILNTLAVFFLPWKIAPLLFLFCQFLSRTLLQILFIQTWGTTVYYTIYKYHKGVCPSTMASPRTIYTRMLYSHLTWIGKHINITGYIQKLKFSKSHILKHQEHRCRNMNTWKSC